MYTGIDIGGTKCAVCLADDDGKIVKKIRFETASVDETLKNIFSAVETLGTTKSIGISCGGPLDSKNGIILSPPNLPGWDNIKIVDMLEEKFSVPARLCNDANACALAEYKFGAGIGTKNMIFLTFGTGMGAGLILNGTLYEGTNDMAGEIGHIRLCDYGPVGYGKSGSVEGFCSGGGIAELGKILARESLQMGKSVSYCESIADIEKISAKKIAEKSFLGFSDAKKVYDICGEMLGRTLSILIDLLNPERIVIGSIYQRSGELLRDRMMSVIESECLTLSSKVCEIVPAKLGDEIGDVAAIAVAEETMTIMK